MRFLGEIDDLVNDGTCVDGGHSCPVCAKGGICDHRWAWCTLKRLFSVKT